ncbi:MAG: hypothetical protein ACYCV7_09105, partial [Acidimicrobiales bacterium]
ALTNANYAGRPAGHVNNIAATVGSGGRTLTREGDVTSKSRVTVEVVKRQRHLSAPYAFRSPG